MANKKILGKEARKLILEAICETADVVGSTMGAKGRNVILDGGKGAPLVVNDGVTICREIEFKDPVKNMAVNLVKEAANRTNYEAGDGTSATVLLSANLLEAGWEAVWNGENPVLFRKALEEVATQVVNNLAKASVPVVNEEDVKRVARVSVQDIALGDKIGEVMFKAGSNGAVTIKSAVKQGVEVKQVGGMRLEGQLMSGVLDNGERFETTLEKAKVLILKDELSDHDLINKWVPLVRQFTVADPEGKLQAVKVPVFLVIAEKLPRQIEVMMNQNKNIIKWVWFRPTTADKNMKEVYKDLQSLLGGEIACEEDGVFLSTMGVNHLGDAELAIINRHEAIISVIEKAQTSDRYLARCNIVKEQINNAEDETEQEQIKERYANLIGGVATILVQGRTEQETVELKLRIEDAINAARAAIEDGVVAGGGVALRDAVIGLEGGLEAIETISRAGRAPYYQILANAGIDTDSKCVKNKGYDVVTGKQVDMFEAGIIDPLKVVTQAFLNALSVAGLLLTSEYVISVEEDDDIAKVKEILNKKD